MDCSQAESFYSKNEQIGKEGESAVETNSLDRQSRPRAAGASRPQSAPSSSRPQTNSNSRRPSQRKQQAKKAQPKKQQKKRPSTGGKRRLSSSGGGPKSRRPSTQGRRKPSSGVTAQPPPPPPQGLGLFVEYDVTLEDGGGGEDYDGGFPVLLAGTAVDSPSPKSSNAATAPLPSYGARG